MNIFKKTFLLIMFITAYILAETADSNQQNQLNDDLQFEMSQQKISWRSGTGAPPPAKPIYMATMLLKDLPYSIENSRDFRESLKDLVSPQQYNFMFQSYRFLESSRYSEDPNKFVIAFHAVTEDDVKIMAKSFVKLFNKNAKEKIEKARSDWEDNCRKHSELEKLIAKQIKDENDIKAELVELEKDVPYRSIEDAHATLQEFNKVLQLANVEISGIEAKLSMIKQQNEQIKNLNSGQNYPKDASELLFQMRLTQEIELAGALARKNTAQSIQRKALYFCNLVERSDEHSRMIKKQHVLLMERKKQTSESEQELDKLLENMKPLELASNKVTIYQSETK